MSITLAQLMSVLVCPSFLLLLPLTPCILVQLDMCLYSTNASLAGTHQSCIPAGLNTRNFVCDYGYSRTNNTVGNFGITTPQTGSGAAPAACTGKSHIQMHYSVLVLTVFSS